MAVLLEEEKKMPVGAGEDMSQYLQDIRQFPLLSQQEEQQLAKRCAAGDEDAIRQMVNSNLRLVVSVAKGYIGRGAPLLDMIQEGSIGLVTAARKFDPEMDCRFSTYATNWIRQGVSRCVMEHAGLIRVPRHTAEKIKKLMKIRQELQQSGSPADLEALASASEIPLKKVEELMQMLPQIQSLDATEEDGAWLGLFLEDTQTPEPQEELIRQEMKQILDQLLGQLTQRQQQVLRMHYGLDGGECCSLGKIGEALGISKERARQIEREAVDKLQKLGTGFDLKAFLD